MSGMKLEVNDTYPNWLQSRVKELEDRNARLAEDYSKMLASNALHAADSLSRLHRAEAAERERDEAVKACERLQAGEGIDGQTPLGKKLLEYLDRAEMAEQQAKDLHAYSRTADTYNSELRAKLDDAERERDEFRARVEKLNAEHRRIWRLQENKISEIERFRVCERDALTAAERERDEAVAALEGARAEALEEAAKIAELGIGSRGKPWPGDKRARGIAEFIRICIERPERYKEVAARYPAATIKEPKP